MRHVVGMGDSKDVYRVLVGKPEGKRPLGQPRHGWEDNITMDVQEAGLGGMDWIDLAQDREGGGHLQIQELTFGFHKMRGCLD